MSDWRVILTADFQTDIRNIHNYIANVLAVPATAAKQIRQLLNAAQSLSDMPLRFSLYEKEPWRSRGLRTLPVDRFVLFYWTNERTREVIVFRALYGGRNIEEILHPAR